MPKVEEKELNRFENEYFEIVSYEESDGLDEPIVVYDITLKADKSHFALTDFEFEALKELIKDIK